MRIIVLFTFLLASNAIEAQSFTNVQNMGDRYRISAPFVQSPHVAFDAKRIRISVTCVQTLATEVAYVSEGGYVDFQMNGQQRVSATTEYLNKGVKVGQKSHLAVCFMGLNPIIQCNKRL